MNGYLYILQSEVNNRFYIDSTVHLEKRLKEHNNGKSKYTSITKPFRVVFRQEYKDMSSALKAEKWLKKQKSRILIKKIIEDKKLTKEF